MQHHPCQAISRAPNFFAYDVRPDKLRIYSSKKTNKSWKRDTDSEVVLNSFYEPLYYIVLTTESQRTDVSILRQSSFQYKIIIITI